MSRIVASLSFLGAPGAIAAPLHSIPAKLDAEISYLEKSPFIRDGRAEVFPKSALSFADPAEWQAIGHAHGNRIGVRPATDPETGAPLTEFWLEARNPEKRWLHWEKRFPGQISREGMEGISLEIFPLTPVPPSLRMQFGLPLPVRDIGPAWQANFGALTPGRGNRLEIRRGSNRHPFPAGIRFVADISRSDVPQREEIRFLVRNLQAIPTGALRTNPPSSPAEVSAPFNAAWVVQTSAIDLLHDEPITITLDLAVERPLEGRLHLRLSAIDADSSAPTDIAVTPVELRPPVTRIKIDRQPAEHMSPQEGRFRMDLAITDKNNALILRTTDPFEVALFDEKHFEAQLAVARERATTLRAQASKLSAQGILTEEPSITLEVADLFLSRFIPDDYHGQKERSIALILLEQVSSLLDKAGTELEQRSSGEVRELPVPHRYDPSLPVEIRGSRLYQDGHPLLLFGAQQETSEFDANNRLSKLGFNSVLVEIPPSLYRSSPALPELIEQAKANNLAVHLLFSTHYMDVLPRGGHASHVMLPYDILHPEVRPLIAQAYQDVLSPLRPFTNLVSVGTANEPGYAVGPQATLHESAFRTWLRHRDDATISLTNARWGAAHASYESITLGSVLDARKDNPAIRHDWERYRAETLGNHFGFMRDQALAQLPERMIWVKKYHTLGFGQIDPEVLFDQGATIHNWSSLSSPIHIDYARGIAPSAPVGCTEWKLVPGFTTATPEADPKRGSLFMFENYARGLSQGIIWKWSRRPWRAHGDPHTFTRYPTAMNEIGRTSHRLQQLAPAFDRLATLGDGAVAVLFDKASLLHQGQSYEADFESLYWRLNRNSLGVRILHAGRATIADLAPRRLIAAGTANALDAPSMHALRNWVHDQGGTLWLSTPGALALDPWGKPHAESAGSNTFLDLVSAASSTGTHKLGNGQVVVDAAWTGYATFLNGPFPIEVETGAPIVKDVECRLVSPDTVNGRSGYFYILNRTDTTRSVTLSTSSGDAWMLPDAAREIWNAQGSSPAPSGEEIKLTPWSVLLFEIEATGTRP